MWRSSLRRKYHGNIGHRWMSMARPRTALTRSGPQRPRPWPVNAAAACRLRGLRQSMETRRPAGQGQRRPAGSVRSMTARPAGRRPGQKSLPESDRRTRPPPAPTPQPKPKPKPKQQPQSVPVPHPHAHPHPHPHPLTVTVTVTVTVKVNHGLLNDGYNGYFRKAAGTWRRRRRSPRPAAGGQVFRGLTAVRVRASLPVSALHHQLSDGLQRIQLKRELPSGGPFASFRLFPADVLSGKPGNPLQGARRHPHFSLCAG